MNKSRFGALGTVCLALIMAVMVGCSGDDAIVADLPDGAQSSATSAYFPVADGYTTVYQVTNNGSTDLVRFEIDGRAPQPHGDKWLFVATLPSGARDTSFIKVTSQAVYHYDHTSSDPETILQAPLRVGHSWQRFGISSPEAEVQEDSLGFSLGELSDLLKGDGTATTLGDYNFEGYKPDDDRYAGKTFPTEGRLEMRIQNEEQLVLSNGRHYSYVLRLSNVQASGVANYYWYAPGVGLVRYALGATTYTYPNAPIVGELVEFGTK